MPDEADSPEESTPAPEQSAAPDGTPAPESTDSTAQDTTDWQDRYVNQQAALTQAQQEAAQYRQIVELARQGNAEAIEWLGLDLAEDEDLDDDEEQEFRDPRVDQLLQAEAERQQEAELDSIESYVETEIDKLAKAAGLDDLSDDEVDLIFGALTPGDNGNPDVAGAFKKVTGLRDSAIKSYVAGKRRAPLAPSGSSASHQPDLDDPEQRREWLAERLAS